MVHKEGSAPHLHPIDPVSVLIDPHLGYRDREVRRRRCQTGDDVRSGNKPSAAHAPTAVAVSAVCQTGLLRVVTAITLSIPRDVMRSHRPPRDDGCRQMSSLIDAPNVQVRRCRRDG